MNTVTWGAVLAASLLAGIFILLETGRRIGARQLARDGEAAMKGLAPIQGAIFGLLGLTLAFSFSGGLAHFDARRVLVAQEANEIGTAWLRIDLLPPGAQPPMRDLFRRYLDSRLTAYAKLPDVNAAREELAGSERLQKQIWALAVPAAGESASPQATMLFLSSLNTMFDIATTRAEATRLHPPRVIFTLIGVLVLACSVFAGYDMAVRPRIHPLHSVLFAVVLSATVYLIVDLEYPRFGFVQIRDSDEALIDLRRSLNGTGQGASPEKDREAGAAVPPAG